MELYQAEKLPKIIKRHIIESWKIFVKYRRVLHSRNIIVRRRVFSCLLRNYNSNKEKQDLAERYLKHRSEALMIRCFEAFSYFNKRLKGRIEKVRSYYGLKLKFNAFRTLKSSFIKLSTVNSNARQRYSTSILKRAFTSLFINKC